MPTLPASGGVHIPGTSSDDTVSDLLGSGSGAPAQPPVPPKQFNLFPRHPHPTVLLFRLQLFSIIISTVMNLVSQKCTE